MHIFTHLKAASDGKTGHGIYADGMIEHDGHVGLLLAKLKELGLEDNTIVMYSTDNGAETFTWPDGGTTMFRGEKNTHWEGGYRVPTMIKWPGVIKPGTVINDIGAHEDMLPTLVDRSGRQELQGGPEEGRRRSAAEVLQGAPGRLRPRPWRSEAKRRSGRAATSSTGPTTARSRHCVTTTGRSRSWSSRPRACRSGRMPFTPLRAPVLANLRMDPVRACRVTKTPWATSAGTWSICVPDRARGCLRGPVAAELQGFSAAPETGQLQSRPGDGNGDEQQQAVTAVRGNGEGHGPRRLLSDSRGSIRWRADCLLLSWPWLTWALSSTALAQADPLTSWNDGTSKARIVAFVEAVTKPGGKDFVAPARTHRGVRQRRHAVGRAARCTSRLFFALGPRQGAAPRASGVEDASSRSPRCSRATWARRWRRR